jgi:hypothetical protein
MDFTVIMQHAWRNRSLLFMWKINRASIQELWRDYGATVMYPAGRIGNESSTCSGLIGLIEMKHMPCQRSLVHSIHLCRSFSVSSNKTNEDEGHPPKEGALATKM